MPNNAKMDSIRFKLPYSTKAKFQIRCVKEKTNMSKVLNSLLNQYLNKQGENPCHTAIQ